MTQLTAWDFLPDNLQSDDPANDLYPWLAPLIDWALPVPAAESTFLLDDLAARMGFLQRENAPVDYDDALLYEDAEAFNAYFNTMIRPLIGTRPAIDLALKFMGLNARIIEWFDDVGSFLPAYKFIIEFDSFPPTMDFSALVDLILQLKNERSWLVSIRMRGCDDQLREHYNGEIAFADIDGYSIDLNLIVCLFVMHTRYVLMDTLIQASTSHASLDLPYLNLPYLLVDQVAGDIADKDWFITGEAGEEQPILWS